MNIGERLKTERLRLKYSQAKFAEIVSAKKHAQINWEKGLTTPTAAAMAAWSLIGLDVLYVITGQHQDQRCCVMQGTGESGYLSGQLKKAPSKRTAPVPSPLTKHEQTLLNNFRKSSVKGKETILSASAALAQLNERIGGVEPSPPAS